ncbi:tape measure protein [Blautia massiliensis]|uniref:tape measure protein n=1 Tax=Blautia massiliensis (ex Durand et al. 2017) TaxID=1737424 RepID=UPI00156DBAA9|nr:tape measure protein [Blautia massiliensis (ex Durand et al. 2017)]NSK80149.1 tape measure protein [Blautia massiliensis (ex Durand et al. 2017)]
MSETIDSKVVEMRFDNKDFEANTRTTMSTLDKLKAKLHFPGASKGLEEIGQTAKRVDFSGMSSGIQTVQMKFSALQVMGITALQNITNAAISAGKQLTDAITIDPVKDGFAEYETQMNSVQTILANTQKEGTNIDQVNKALKELNTYADQTIYNFTEMTRNIGTFTAAGVKLDDSVSAIKGIANLAAVSGSTSQQASTAMYQLSQALAAGKVQLMDWNSVVNAGMGGQVFQDALIRTSEHLQTGAKQAIEAYGSFRESLTEGEWLTTDVLTETLNQIAGAYSKEDLIAQGYSESQAEEIVKLADTATDAATKVKTFTQLIDTLKEALGSGWTESWQIIIGDFEEAKEVWTKVSDVLGGFIQKSSEARNAILKAAMGNPYSDLAKNIQKVTSATSDYKDIVDSVIRGDYGSGQARFDKLAAEGHDWARVQNLINERLGCSFRYTEELATSQEDLNKEQAKTIKQILKMSDAELKKNGLTKEDVKALKELQKQSEKTGIPINDLINDMDKLSGKELLHGSVANMGNALINLFTEIHNAWQKVFDPVSAMTLYNIIASMHGVTSKFLKFTEDRGKELTRTLAGVFAALDIIRQCLGGSLKFAIKAVNAVLSAFDMDILDATAKIGDLLVKFDKWLKKTDPFTKGFEEIGKVIKSVVDDLTKFENKIKKLPNIENFLKTIEKIKSPKVDFSGVINGFSELSNTTTNSSFSNIRKLFSALWKYVTEVGLNIIDTIGKIGTSIAQAFGKDDVFEVINSGLIAGILVFVKKLTKNITKVTDDAGGILNNVTEILDGVKDCFVAYQEQLRAGALLKIASAIGILTASVFTLSTIDSDALQRALFGIAALLIELGVALAAFGKMSNDFKGSLKANFLMKSLAVSILIMAAAVKVLSTISWEGMMKGLIAIGGLLLELSLFLSLTDFKKKSFSSSAGMVLIASALLILSSVVKKFENVNWETLGRSLVSIGALLLEISIFANLAGKAKHVISTGLSLILVASGLKILASVVDDFSGMNWDEIKRGLTAMGAALLEITIALKLLPKTSLFRATGLIVAAAALKIVANDMNDFASMNWPSIKKAAITMGIALGEIVIALNLMKGTLGGAAALIVASAALAILASTMSKLGKLSSDEIAKGLIAMAAAFFIVGVAGALLQPLIPTILALAAAFVLFGVAALSIGAGLTLVGVGLTTISIGLSALGGSLATAAVSIVAGLSVIILGVAGLIPAVAEKIAEGVVAFATVIGDCAPQIIDAVLKLFDEVLKSANAYLPTIIDSVLTLLIAVINGVANHIPEIMLAITNLVGKIVEGVTDVIKGLNPDEILKATEAIGILLASIFGFAGISKISSQAMAGIVQFGIILAELSAVIAAAGGIAQIPGASWLIEEGGNFLEKIGTAIGQFVGGLAGGVAKGVSSSLPAIGKNLSDFMKNAQPFIDGAKGIDSSVTTGITSLCKAILALTGTDLLNAIASFITGGASFVKMGEQLKPFGEALSDYAQSVKGIDAKDIQASAKAAKALVSLNDALPKSGGFLGALLGNSDLSNLGTQLKPFGEALSDYSNSVANVSPGKVANASTAVKSLVEAINATDSVKATGTSTFVQAVDTLAETNISGFVSAFKGSSSKVKNVGSTLTSALASGVKSKSNTLSTTASNMAESMKNSIASKDKEFQKVGVALISALAIGIQAQVNQAVNAANYVGASAANGSGQAYTSFYMNGINLGRGLVLGMNAMQQSAYNSGYALGQAAVRGEKDGQKSHSPSKLTIQAGKWLGEGLIIGMNAMESKTYGAGKSMGETAFDSIRSALSGMNDIIDSDMDTTPTIRPVLDLTNVKATAGKLNGLFTDPAFTPLANLRAIGNISARNNQNGNSDEVVRAINRLGKSLNNVGNTYNSINGVTYDNGSEISNAVETLVRAATVGRRR